MLLHLAPFLDSLKSKKVPIMMKTTDDERITAREVLMLSFSEIKM